MTGIRIRPAKPGDASRMAELDKICFSQPWSKLAFTSELRENSAAKYFVCVRASRIIGYAGAWAVLDEGHITNVAVHPDFRRQGLAAMLLTELIAYMVKNTETLKFTLEVRISNSGAIELYEKFGFERCGLRKKYYSDTMEDAVIMWRSWRDGSGGNDDGDGGGWNGGDDRSDGGGWSDGADRSDGGGENI
ncbi:MAG: ribosomal protein S18-alanine N-acetyltransferase [Clostridiales Family XIII bacterium]|jgi:ribosomal-protein-alanine N-acetyltransferase|nr:ribosomal protein S18-alanine N-acetyltransferase [Clostridiales Family XIII bacterium]